MNYKQAMQKMKRQVRSEWMKNCYDSFGRCTKCNGEYHFSQLQLNHINPEDKSANPSDMKLLKKSKIQAELNKCEIVCANCHSLITWKQRKCDNWNGMYQQLVSDTGYG